jgi:hypothetical protein
MADAETWLPIEGYEGLYDVSDLGRIRAVKSGIIRRDARGRKSYRLISLFKDGAFKTFSVHVLVAHAFHGQRPQGLHCCHLNGAMDDNRATNLAYVTAKENNAHKLLHGTQQHGETHGSAKLTDATVIDLRRRVRNGERLTDLAREVGVWRTTVLSAVKGKTWKHLPDPVESW